MTTPPLISVRLLSLFWLLLNSIPQPKKFVSLLSVLSDLECYVYKRKYFNKNLLKPVICYRKLIYAIYPHILIMDTSVELPAKRHFSVYICTVLRSIHAAKKCPGLLHYLFDQLL